MSDIVERLRARSMDDDGLYADALDHILGLQDIAESRAGALRLNERQIERLRSRPETHTQTPVEEINGWETEADVFCVVCPECAFTMDAAHLDPGGESYTCPLCSSVEETPEPSPSVEGQEEVASTEARTAIPLAGGEPSDDANPFLALTRIDALLGVLAQAIDADWAYRRVAHRRGDIDLIRSNLRGEPSDVEAMREALEEIGNMGCENWPYGHTLTCRCNPCIARRALGQREDTDATE